MKPRIVNYRDYKNLCNDTFQQILLEKLSAENINTNYSGFEKFLQICIGTFVLTYLLLVRKNTHKEIICLS